MYNKEKLFTLVKIIDDRKIIYAPLLMDGPDSPDTLWHLVHYCMDPYEINIICCLFNTRDMEL